MEPFAYIDYIPYVISLKLKQEWQQQEGGKIPVTETPVHKYLRNPDDRI